MPENEFENLAAGAKRPSLLGSLTKPVSVISILLALGIAAMVFLLQQDPASLTMTRPRANYELLPNEGLTEGLPIGIHLGPLTVFEISDPLAGGGGAARAKQVVENLNEALTDLEESPGRVITIDSGEEQALPRIVQKAESDSEDALEIVRVTPDDMVLAQTGDSGLLARVWAERLTDSLRLLLFGEPPEFSRDSAFGSALDTLYVNAMAETGRLTSSALDTAFEELPENLREALTSFPSLAPPEEEPPAAADGGPRG